MENYKKILNNDFYTIINSDKTFKDIYKVMFSHSEQIAYERLVDFEIEEVTYRTLDLRIREFAAFLKHKHHGINSEYIGIDLENSPGFLIAFWGILMSGNKPYLINSFYPQELKDKLLKRLDIKLVITNADDYGGFNTLSPDNFDKDCPQITDEYWQNEFALSSALTGLEAKICVFNGEAVVNQILNSKRNLKINNWIMSDYKRRIKIALILPLFHIFGIMVCYFWYAFFGRTMVFFKDSSPETVRGTIKRHNVTHIFAPPVLFHKLYKGIMNGILQESKARQKKFQTGLKIAFFLQNVFPSFGVAVSRILFKEILSASFGPSPRFMISGGAHIDPEALKTINCIGYPLVNGYGTTETAIAGANLSKKIGKRISGSIGKPLKSANYTIDADGTLVVSGASICKRIITLKGEESGFDNIKTNDLVEIKNGEYYIVGRKSDLFIGDNGENISPDTIQNELKVKSANRFCILEINGKLSIVLEYNKKLPGIVIANEIEKIKSALSDITYGEYVKGIFITYEPIANQNAIKVSRALLRKKIADGEVVLKDYKELTEDEKQNNGAKENETISVIKQAFKNALDADTDIKLNDDFFLDLGGDSLGYFSLISELEKIFNIQFNLERNKSLRTPESFYNFIIEML